MTDFFHIFKLHFSMKCLILLFKKAILTPGLVFLVNITMRVKIILKLFIIKKTKDYLQYLRSLVFKIIKKTHD